MVGNANRAHSSSTLRADAMAVQRHLLILQVSLLLGSNGRRLSLNEGSISESDFGKGLPLEPTLKLTVLVFARKLKTNIYI